jgi:hypothetical protein
MHLEKEKTINKVQRHPYFPIESMIHKYPFFFSFLMCSTTSVAMYLWWQQQNKNKRCRQFDVKHLWPAKFNIKKKNETKKQRKRAHNAKKSLPNIYKMQVR